MKKGFDYKKRREFRGWGAKREWPVLNPQHNNPNEYKYISMRFITRIIFR